MVARRFSDCFSVRPDPRYRIQCPQRSAAFDHLARSGRLHHHFAPCGQAGRPASQWVPGPGHVWVGAGTAFTRERRLPATLVVVWAAGQAEPWVVLTPLPPRQVGVLWYGLRMWIENRQPYHPDITHGVPRGAWLVSFLYTVEPGPAVVAGGWAHHRWCPSSLRERRWRSRKRATSAASAQRIQRWGGVSSRRAVTHPRQTQL